MRGAAPSGAALLRWREARMQRILPVREEGEGAKAQTSTLRCGACPFARRAMVRNGEPRADGGWSASWRGQGQNVSAQSDGPSARPPVAAGGGLKAQKGVVGWSGDGCVARPCSRAQEKLAARWGKGGPRAFFLRSAVAATSTAPRMHHAKGPAPCRHGPLQSGKAKAGG